MNKKIIYLLVWMCFILFFTACNNDKLGPSIIDIPEQSDNATDQYIYENYIQKYNIDVIYRWEHTQTDLAKNLIPPKEKFVIPFLNTVKSAWISPYVEIEEKSKGTFIFPRYVPKQMLLIGSSGYNNDGTVTQGTAEGGKKIVLYEINNYDAKNLSVIQRYFHVMHHEFGHILHQTREFSTEYQTISTGLYTSTWYLVKEADARKNGFITNYAMSEYHEDFVEMVAMMLTRDSLQWNKLLESFPASGKTQILKKEKYVISYFKEKWNIDIFDLQKTIQRKINEYMDAQNQELRSSEISDHGNYETTYFSYEENNVCQFCRLKLK